MPTFEEGFAAVEAAAEEAEAAVRILAATARRLRKAAQEGAVAKLQSEAHCLASALSATDETVARAAAAWPFDDSAATAYMGERYANELRSAAASIGLNVSSRDEALVCSPSILRLLPAEAALKIDGKKRKAIRPSKLAADLRAIQHRMRPKSDAQQQRFLEALYKAFRIIRGKTSDPLLDATRVVPLSEVYAVFTSLPGSGTQYTRTDFARDIYLLDSSSVAVTRSGARVSFTDSARRSSGILSFVDRNGNVIRYYGVQFTE